MRCCVLDVLLRNTLQSSMQSRCLASCLTSGSTLCSLLLKSTSVGKLQLKENSPHWNESGWGRLLQFKIRSQSDFVAPTQKPSPAHQDFTCNSCPVFTLLPPKSSFDFQLKIRRPLHPLTKSDFFNDYRESACNGWSFNVLMVNLHELKKVCAHFADFILGHSKLLHPHPRAPTHIHPPTKTSCAIFALVPAWSACWTSWPACQQDLRAKCSIDQSPFQSSILSIVPSLWKVLKRRFGKCSRQWNMD